MKRSDFLKHVKEGRFTKDQDIHVLEKAVDILLMGLFIPDQARVYYLDPVRTKEFEVDEEDKAVWGALSCFSVVNDNLVYKITLTPGVPGKCTSLCDYIHRFVLAFGWQNEVSIIPQ